MNKAELKDWLEAEIKRIEDTYKDSKHHFLLLAHPAVRLETLKEVLEKLSSD